MVCKHNFECCHTATAVCGRNQLLGNNCLKYVSKLNTNLLLLMRRENVDNTVDRGCCTDGMQGGKNQVARFCCGYGYGNGFVVTHLTYKDDIGVFTKCSTKCVCITHGVETDFTLVNHCYLVDMQVLDRVFQGNDVSITVVVCFINDGSKGCGLTGTGRTGNQYKTSLTVVKIYYCIGNTKLCR